MSPSGNEQYCVGASCTNRALAVRISAWILSNWAIQRRWLTSGVHQLRLVVSPHKLQGFIHRRWLAGFQPWTVQPYNPYFSEAEWKTVGFSPSGLFFCDSTCCSFEFLKSFSVEVEAPFFLSGMIMNISASLLKSQLSKFFYDLSLVGIFPDGMHRTLTAMFNVWNKIIIRFHPAERHLTSKTQEWAWFCHPCQRISSGFFWKLAAMYTILAQKARMVILYRSV